MTVHLVTFATQDMEQSSWLCATSSKKHGVGTHARFNPGNLLRNEAHREYWPVLQELFAQPRGCGYWAWKPLIISKELEWLPEGATLIYSDAGVEFINNVNYIVDRMDQDVFLFANMWEHAHWCKRDIIDAIMPGASWEMFGKQVQASVIFFRVSDYSRQFVAEWLKWCLFEGGRLIDDSPSRGMNHPEFQENRWDQAILTTLSYREGVRLHYWPASYCDGAATYPRDYLDIRSNHPEFKENRHDQAILTTMAYREKLGFHKWPSIYNKGTKDEFVYEQGHYEDDYPTLFNHHRRRNHEWSNAA